MDDQRNAFSEQPGTSVSVDSGASAPTDSSASAPADSGERLSVINRFELSQDDWQQMLTQPGLFLLAEAALNEDVPGLAEQFSDPAANRLYWGQSGRIHASVSPYAIRIDQDNWHEMKAICEQPQWGIALQLNPQMNAHTPVDQLIALMNHLRGWSLVKAQPDDDELRLLRISDWQVIQNLLSACSPSETAGFYGPVYRFIGLQKDHITCLEHTGTFTPYPAFQAPRQLTEAQFLAISEKAEQENMQRYALHLRQYHSEVNDWDDQKLMHFINAQLEQAWHYKFRREEELVRYLSLAVSFGPDFTKTPWAASTINDMVSIGPDTRMDRLYQQALASLDKE